MPGPHISVPQRYRIIGRWEAGQKPGKIADLLGYSHTTVARIISKFQETGLVDDRPRSGRPSKVTEPVRSAILTMRNDHPDWTWAKLAEAVSQQCGTAISATNARRSVAKRGQGVRRLSGQRRTKAKTGKTVEREQDGLQSDGSTTTLPVDLTKGQQATDVRTAAAAAAH